ncbi:MAG: hypothetical protein ACYDAG_06270 [Chloroflexota bacterium]
MNVIDTLSEGFAAANKRLWIVAIPVAVDLFLWLGPKVLPGPALGQAVEANLPQQYASYGALIQQSISSFNLLSLLAVYLPSLVARLGTISPLASFAPVTFVNRPLPLLLLALLAALGGLWLGCVYLGFIAQLVRDGSTNAREMARSVWRYWRRLIAFLLMVGLAVVVASVPLSLIFALLASVSPAAGAILEIVVQVAIFWGIISLFFTPEALLLDDVGPIRAMRASFQVIAGNFGASILLIGLMFLISLGLPIAWQFIAGNPVGLVAAIVGNAYIGTGVAAAGFLFFKERLTRLQRVSAPKTAEEV